MLYISQWACNPVGMTGSEEEENASSERKVNRTPFRTTALKHFKVRHGIPDQQVHVIPSVGTDSQNLSPVSYPLLSSFISGNI